MTTIKINNLEIEKIHGGYLVFISTPNEAVRSFLGKYTKEELRELAEGIMEFIN